MTVLASLFLGLGCFPAVAQVGLGLAPLRMEVNARPGAMYSDTLTVSNESEHSTRVRVSTLDFWIDDNQEPQFRASVESKPNSCRTWLRSNPSEFELGNRDLRKNELANLNLSRQLGRQTLRVGLEDLKVRTASEAKQSMTEIEDGVRIGRLNFGGSLRLERAVALDTTNQLAERFFWNASWKRISSYGSYEFGNDLANSSLLTRTGIQTTGLGLTANLSTGWQLRADAYRSNLLISSNPANFALLAQSGYSPAVVLNSEQWTTYFRLSHSLSWAGARSLAQVAEIAKASSIEKGIVDGRVTGLHGLRSELGVPGIPVQLDRSRFALTDQDGNFRFANVPDGQHVVGIDVWHLPTDYETSSVPEMTISVRSRHTSLLNLQLHHLGRIRGQIVDLPPSSAAVIELDGGHRVTTPEDDGTFLFDNVREGSHSVQIRPGTLPKDYEQANTAAQNVTVECNSEGSAKFTVAYSPKPKPIRTIHFDSPN